MLLISLRQVYMSKWTPYMSKYNTTKAVRNKEERPLSQLAHRSRQLHVCALVRARHNGAYLFRTSNLLDLFYQTPAIVHNSIHPVACQLRVVTVDHRATAW